MKKYSSITRVNSHRTSRNRKIKQTIIIVIIASVLLWWLPGFLSGMASVVMSPVYAIEDWFKNSSESLPYFLRDRDELIEEIKTLKDKTPEGGAHQVTIAGLIAENKELRRLTSGNQSERILASVIGRPYEVPYDVLVLDRGETDGIAMGAPVFVSSTTVIGIVSRVYERTSVVELLTAPHFTTAVYVYGPNIYTKAEGVGGGVLKVAVPQGIRLETGNVVVVPSVELGIFGKITHVESSPTDPEQFGFVTTNIPLNNLRLVSVGRAPLQPIDFETARAAVDNTIKSLFEIPIPNDVLVDVRSTSTATTTLYTASTTAL